MGRATGTGMEQLLQNKRDAILRLAQRYGVTNVRVFGSVARGEAGPDSDIDLLVDGLENCAWGGGRLLVELEALLGHQVDLVSEGDLHPLVRDQILREAIPL